MEQEELTLDDIVQKLVDDEMEKYFDKINELEKRIEELELLTSAELLELEKRIEELEQESSELRARIEKLEQAQRSATEVIIRI